MSSEYKYYSVILKGCSHREKLISCLEKTLLRGRLAIKMALDNIPSIIIYKGNVDNIVPVYNAFSGENAAIAILPDGVPPALPISKKYREFFNISPEIQTLLATVPDNLWLGEAIHRIVPARFLDETGALVISSHSIYFIDKPAGDNHSRWLIIPYSKINHSIITNEQESLLTVSYQDTSGQQNDVFSIPSDFLLASKHSIEQAKAAKRYITTIKTSCHACGHISEATLEHASADLRCPQCGQSTQRTIIAL